MFETVIHPRVSETDGVGHINNTVVPMWFEAGRRDLFPLFGPVDDFREWRMIVVNLTVDFITEIRYPTEVVVRSWVERIGTSSLTLYEEMYQNDVLCCRGHATYVNVNPESRKPESISGSVRAALQHHLYTPSREQQ